MKTLLTESLKAVTGRPQASNGPGLREALDTLDRLLRQEGESMHPQLRHFLERRSYTKALEFLDANGGDSSR